MRIIFVPIFIFSALLLNNSPLQAATAGRDDASSSDNPRPTVHGNWYRPPLLVHWQWQLEGDINTSYNAEIYDIDLFDTPQSTIAKLHAEGKKVICYFSAGSYENFREDSDKFLAEELGKTLDGWEDERWLDIRSENVREIMKHRLSLAKQKECDGVEPDNVDGFANTSGFNLTASDQLTFNRFLAKEAHKRGLSVGLKNDLDQVPELVEFYDFAVNEQCFEYNECNILRHFIKQGKPVLHVEYMNRYVTDRDARNNLCKKSLDLQFSTLVLPQELNNKFRYSCL